jgi:signal transduction histidine kinase
MSAETSSLLIVDDEESNREGLARRLQRHGYATTAAASGREAIELLGEGRFDLVLLDIMMPGMNGLEVLKFLRRVDSLLDLPIIMVTARGESGDVVEALELGANDYLTKPLDFPVVLARIRTQLSLKRAEDALREADRHKDEFLAVLGHELRNPLAPLRNALRLLLLQRGGDGEVERLVGVMERQVNHLVRLVDDLLDVNRISRGKIEVRKAPLNLAAVLERCVERIRPQLEERQHALTVSWPAEALPLEADPARLEQVFTNLLSNAGKYTPLSGHIDLLAVREGGEAVVRVKDNGIGIRAEMLGRVFDMFQQADRVSGRECEGLGLGLALVHALVQLHGGSVAAFSDGPDRGSEFVVRLPLAVHAEPAPAEDASGLLPVTVGAVRRLLRLMVVDDQVDGAQTLALLLGMMGHEVRVAHNGPEALEAAAGFRPEVVLLDIGLPGGMDGYEVARRLRVQPGLESTVLVALTGHGGATDRGRAREAGFSDYFVKPVDVEALGRFLDHQAGAGILREGTAFAHPDERPVQTSAAEPQVVPNSSVMTRASHV